MTLATDPPLSLVPPVPVRAPRPGARRLRASVVIGFVLMVVAPAVLGGWYLWDVAADRYASRTAFSIRSNQTTAPLEIFGSITQLGTSSAALDGEILYDFIQSQPMIDAVQRALPLVAIYNRAPGDPLFTLGTDQPVEELLDHWSLMTDVSVEPATGILTVETRAFDPDDAQAIAQAVLEASAALVNDLSEAARDDSVRYAAEDLATAEARLRDIRTRLRAFRDFEQEVDPTRNAQAALELVATLESDRAQAQVQLDQLTGILNADAPRMQSLRRRLATLDAQITEERTRLGTGAAQPGDARPLSAIVGDYEELLVDRDFAEQAYTLALSTFEQAQAEAQRRNRYLAVHIPPTLSERAEYPDRPVWFATLVFGCLALWSILRLLGANLRERR